MGSRKSLDNLLNKLDSQLAEKPNKHNTLGLGIAGAIGGAIGGASPLGTPTLRSNDPLDMKSRMKKTAKAKAIKSNILAKHKANVEPDQDDQDDQDQDLKTNEDFIDENRFKTMDWTEPDGSKTTLRFDEEGTLIGKVKTKKSRPDKFSKDLKQAVDRNEQALANFKVSGGE